MQATDETTAKPGRNRPQRECGNCGATLNGPYCHRCGQPARSLIRALPGLVGEVASETLYYDSRMWRTLKCLLFKPGWLSHEHVHGRRARFIRTAASMLPQTMFVILPLFAAWVGVFYLFSGRYYIEHLLLQVHNHAFLFLSMVGLYMIELVRESLSDADFFGHGLLSGLLYWIAVGIWLWIPIYLLISMKRFYRQGWVLTTTKYFMLGLSYQIMLIFVLLAITVLGVWRL